MKVQQKTLPDGTGVGMGWILAIFFFEGKILNRQKQPELPAVEVKPTGSMTVGGGL